MTGRARDEVTREEARDGEDGFRPMRMRAGANANASEDATNDGGY